jgi:RNA-binding protein
LGTALHVVQKRLVVRGEPGVVKIPKVNSAVFDQTRTKIGRVFEVFGPVKHPYIIVRLGRGVDATLQVGKKLYVEETSRRDGKWKR